MIKEADLNGDGLVDYAGIYNVSLNQYSSYISNEQISIRCSLSKSRRRWGFTSRSKYMWSYTNEVDFI